MITKPNTAAEWTVLGDRMEQVYGAIRRLIAADAPLDQQLALWREAADIAEAAGSPAAVGIRRNIRTCEVIVRMRSHTEPSREKRRRWWRR